MNAILPGLEPVTTIYDFECDGEMIRLSITGEPKNAKREALKDARARARDLGLRGKLTLTDSRVEPNTWDKFCALYRPVPVDATDKDSTVIFDWHTPEHRARVEKAMAENPATVWSMNSCDYDELWFCSTGTHPVNHMGYVITEVPAEEGALSYFYM